MLPQLVVIGLSLLGLGIAIAQHGEPKRGNENVLIQIIAAAILHGVLYWGGFYDVLLK